MGQIGLFENIPTPVVASTTTLTLATTNLGQPTRFNIGGQSYSPSALLTLNTATTGANGLDTGTLLVSSLYYVYAIVNASTFAPALVASLSVPSNGPLMPSGYGTAYKLIATFNTNGSTQVSVASSALNPSGTAAYIPGIQTGQVPYTGLPGVGSSTVAGANVVGETVVSIIPAASSVSLVTTTPKNLLSISLSPGNWLLYGNVSFSGTTTAATFLQAEFSLGANTQNQPPNGQAQGRDGSIIATPASSNLNSIGIFGGSLAPIRVNFNATTTVFIVAYAIFASGAVTICGRAEAVRIF